MLASCVVELQVRAIALVGRAAAAASPSLVCSIFCLSRGAGHARIRGARHVQPQRLRGCVQRVEGAHATWPPRMPSCL